MLKTTSVIILLLGLSVVNGQFYYNYEEDRNDEPPTESQEYNPSLYQYNSPTAVNQQFARSRDTESPPQRTVTRRTSRARSRRPEPELDYNPQPQPQNMPESVPEEQVKRQERRQSRRRQRQSNYAEPTQPPRVYSPSIFENIPLGEAPSGIFVPQDSLLNVLKNPGRGNVPVQAYEPAPVLSQPNRNYNAPSLNYVNNEPKQRFFVEPPPSNEDARQRNVILPVVRPDTQYAVSHPSRVNNRPQPAPAHSQPTARQASQNPRAQPEYAPQPTLDIDSYREYTDDVVRENVQIAPQNRPQSRPRIQVRRRQVFRSNGYQEPTQTPRVYSPSIFENVGLGEAPSGIYVPENSLLNVLRNPTSRRHVSSRAVTEEPQQQFLRQPSEENRVRSEVDYVSEVPDERDSEFSSRRHSGQRSRQAPSSRRTQHPQPGYLERYDDQEHAPAVQTSSQRRTQRVNNNDSNRRQENRVVQERRNSSPQRRQHTVAASKPQPQVPPSRREQSSFKEAKLAIAELPSDTDGDGIPGEAGVSYPTLHVIPQTSFSCSQQPHNGYYADLETACQVVHLCQSGGVQDSFLCPNGTIFSQEKFSCQWWYKVNCADSPRFYAINDNLYKVPEKKDKKKN